MDSHKHTVFVVPGTPKPKKRAAPAAAKKKDPASKKKAKVVDDGYLKPAAKKTKTSKPVAAKKVKSKPNPAAKAALQAAVDSTINGTNGEVDAKCLQRAVRAGYSKFFVLAEVAKQMEDGDSKPAAKN